MSTYLPVGDLAHERLPTADATNQQGVWNAPSPAFGPPGELLTGISERRFIQASCVLALTRPAALALA